MGMNHQDNMAIVVGNMMMTRGFPGPSPHLQTKSRVLPNSASPA